MFLSTDQKLIKCADILCLHVELGTLNRPDCQPRAVELVLLPRSKNVSFKTLCFKVRFLVSKMCPLW